MRAAHEEFGSPSEEAITVLRLLKHHHNVLITGSSRTGKSRLLAEVRHWFMQSARPMFSPTGPNAFPEGVDIEGIEEWLPSPERFKRATYSITFHQGTKRRDLIDGVTPAIGADDRGFMVTRGPLVFAVQHATDSNGAALVEIDELNRGPAVAIFGDVIKAMETDKRLLQDGSIGPNTASFQVLDERGHPSDCQLPHHVYILAAMNEADTSVEALDVAFLSRFQPYRLLPDPNVVRDRFALGRPSGPLPEAPGSAGDVLEATIRAWEKANAAIEIARGPEYQIGHGIFLSASAMETPNTTAEALQLAVEVWGRVHQHLREVFFGSVHGLAEALNVGSASNPYSLEERFFANEPVARIVGPTNVRPDEVYRVLRAVAGS